MRRVDELSMKSVSMQMEHGCGEQIALCDNRRPCPTKTPKLRFKPVLAHVCQKRQHNNEMISIKPSLKITASDTSLGSLIRSGTMQRQSHVDCNIFCQAINMTPTKQFRELNYSVHVNFNCWEKNNQVEELHCCDSFCRFYTACQTL